MLEECDHLNINMYCCQKGGLGVVDLVVYVVCMCLCTPGQSVYGIRSYIICIH